MKRLITLFLILTMIIPAAALADLPDISGLSYEELVQLKDQINLAMWNSQEWQRVLVPKGIWEIGADIPEGHWTMTPNGSHVGMYVYVDAVDSTGAQPDPDCDVWDAYWVSTERLSKDVWKDSEMLHELSLNMAAGMFIVLPCDTYFTPYAGKPDLGFN